MGHRSSRRPGGLRRLLHRRPPPETTNAVLDAGLGSRSAEYRALHRAQGAQRAQPAERAEQPGISWGSGRPGPAQRPAEEVNERFDPDQAAREHLAGLRPDEPTALAGVPGDPEP